MAGQVCTGCTTVFAVGAAVCPHCGARKWVEQGSREHGKWLSSKAAAAVSAGDDRQEAADA